MRVTGGSCRGKRLHVPGGSRTRPTSDRVREALFNILRDLEGLFFLDLCAGSGAVGIEALSRGALRAVFVEQDRRTAETLARNIRGCGLEGAAEILEMDARAGIRRLSRRGDRFDIVFADPPYTGGLAGEILKETAGWPLLAPGGMLVLQHSIREEGTDPAAAWRLTDSRRYGDTALSFYETLSSGESNP